MLFYTKCLNHERNNVLASVFLSLVSVSYSVELDKHVCTQCLEYGVSWKILISNAVAVGNPSDVYRPLPHCWHLSNVKVMVKVMKPHPLGHTLILTHMLPILWGLMSVCEHLEPKWFYSYAWYCYRTQELISCVYTWVLYKWRRALFVGGGFLKMILKMFVSIWSFVLEELALSVFKHQKEPG